MGGAKFAGRLDAMPLLQSLSGTGTAHLYRYPSLKFKPKRDCWGWVISHTTANDRHQESSVVIVLCVPFGTALCTARLDAEIESMWKNAVPAYPFRGRRYVF
jgi:hypothetical protein